MLNAVFLSVPGDAKIELGIVFFGPLADSAPMNRLFGTGFAFELAAANPRCRSVAQLRVKARTKEDKVI